MTATGAILGTPAYMAPEQATGRAKFVLPTTDVWALGVILYECLVGKRPFEGSDPWVIFQALQHEEPISLRKIEPAIPRDLALICAKCLAKEPAERYPSAAEFADDLGRFVRNEPVTVRAAGTAERAIKWVRRKPAQAAAIIGVLLATLLAVFGGIVSVLLVEAMKSRDSAKSAQVEAEAARTDAETARVEAVSARNSLDEEKKQTEKARDELATANTLLTKAQDQLVHLEYGRTVQVAYQEWKEGKIASAR